MKLLTFSTNEDPRRRLGIHLEDETIIDASLAYQRHFGNDVPDSFESVSDLLIGGDSAMQQARNVLDAARNDTDSIEELCLDSKAIRFHPPAGDAAKILCVTMNYGSHVAASGGAPSDEPYFFIKMPSTMTGHRQPICLSRTSQRHDSEIELAVIIGKQGKYISRESAFDHVAGYTLINDLSFRDRRTLANAPSPAQLHWFTLKNLDTAAPIGPWLVSRDEIPDPYALEISLTLANDLDEQQTGSTEGMLHRIEDLLVHASNGVTLEPGDVIATGTPHEIAFGHERWLRDGDVVYAQISGIGALVNTVRAES